MQINIVLLTGGGVVIENMLYFPPSISLHYNSILGPGILLTVTPASVTSRMAPETLPRTASYW